MRKILTKSFILNPYSHTSSTDPRISFIQAINNQSREWHSTLKVHYILLILKSSGAVLLKCICDGPRPIPSTETFLRLTENYTRITVELLAIYDDNPSSTEHARQNNSKERPPLPGLCMFFSSVHVEYTNGDN